MVLSILAAATVPQASHAQSLFPAPDSTFTKKFSITKGLDLSKNIASYKLDLSNGFSLKTQDISTVNAMKFDNFRRGNILPKEELLYGQRFSLGASYNGLNNMLKGGFGGMNSRNPGLSLHAGIRF